MQNDFLIDNVLFESRITFTKDFVKEYLRAWFFKSKLWLILLIPTVIAIVGIIMIIVDNSDFQVLGVGISLEIIFLLVIFLRYYNGSRIMYARICEQNNGQETTNIIQFFDNDILTRNPLTGNKLNYSYLIVKQIYVSENLIILITAAKVLIVVEKIRFTIGSPDELIVFIKAKIKACQNIKV